MGRAMTLRRIEFIAATGQRNGNGRRIEAPGLLVALYAKDMPLLLEHDRRIGRGRVPAPAHPSPAPPRPDRIGSEARRTPSCRRREVAFVLIRPGSAGRCRCSVKMSSP